MTERIGLSPDQLVELTGYRRATKQCLALTSMKIAFRVRLDGTPFVTHSALGIPEETKDRAIPIAIVS